VQVIVRPFLLKPSYDTWREFVAYLANVIGETAVDLVVFDTFAAFNPSPDENDASKMQEALAPLHRLTESGAAVLLVHHLRKASAKEGQRSRGSSALTGFADVIAELNRTSGGLASSRRVLGVLSRFVDNYEIVLERTPDGYKAVGTPAEAKLEERDQTIHRILASALTPLSIAEVHAAWPDDPKPNRKTIERALREGEKGGCWKREGAGKSGDPYRYSPNAKSGLDTPLSNGSRPEMAVTK
jgi:hypothetical protein